MAESETEKRCVGCVIEYHEGALGVGYWSPDPMCPMHGDPELLAQLDRVNEVLNQLPSPIFPAPALEGTVVESSDNSGRVTVEKLVNVLAALVRDRPDVAAMPVSFQTHCCTQGIDDGTDPEVVEVPGQRPYLLLTLRDEA